MKKSRWGCQYRFNLIKQDCQIRKPLAAGTPKLHHLDAAQT
jgi:hypothetical protein